MMDQLRYIDVFAGIGGFRAAAESISAGSSRLGPVGHVEIDPRCRSVYHSVWPEASTEWSPLDIRDVLRQNGLGIPDLDLIFAGFPCQSFANIGRRTGLDDERGELFHYLVDLVLATNPLGFVFENVAKLAVLDKGAVLAQMLIILRSCGYHVAVTTLTATDFGLPQSRRRLFFLGVRRDIAKDVELEEAVLGIRQRRSGLADLKCSWDVLEKAMPAAHVVPLRTRNTVLRPNPKWQGRLAVNPRIARPVTATMGKWHRANQDSYFTEDFVFSSRDEARFDLPVEQVGDQALRRLTPTETLRLQGFPSSFAHSLTELAIPPTAAFRLTGNSVPVPMAAAAISTLLPLVG